MSVAVARPRAQTVVPFSDYGAVGDGTDETVKIQNGLTAVGNAGGGILKAVAGKVYGIAPVASKLFANSSATPINYCLEIPPNVILDIEGATLKRLGTAIGTMICNKSPNVLTDTKIGLWGARGLIDGSGVVFATAGEAVRFEGVTDLYIDARIYNVDCQAMAIWNCENVRSRYIWSDLVSGQGIQLGTPTADRLVRKSQFGVLVGTRHTAWAGNTFNYPGNPAYLLLEDSSVESIWTDLNSGGVKVDRPGRDWSCGRVYIGRSTTGNSGLKFQGDSDGILVPRRVSVGELVAVDNYGHGLWSNYAVDCSVGSYHGRGNGLSGIDPDVWIGGRGDQIGSLTSENAGSSGVTFRSYAEDFSIGQATVRSPGRVVNSPGIVDSGGRGHVGSATLIGDGTAKSTYGFDAQDIAARTTIKRLSATGWSIAPYRLAPFASPNGGMMVDKDVRLDGTRTHAEIALRGNPAYAGGVYLVPGRWTGDPRTVTGSTVAPALNAAYAIRFPVANPGTLSEIGVETVTTPGSAGAVARFGIYLDSNGLPGALLLDAGTLATDDAVGWHPKAISQVLGPGQYWLAFCAQVAASAVVRITTGSESVLPEHVALQATNPAGRNSYQTTGITGALPATWGAAQSAGSSPRMVVKAA